LKVEHPSCASTFAEFCCFVEFLCHYLAFSISYYISQFERPLTIFLVVQFPLIAWTDDEEDSWYRYFFMAFVDSNPSPYTLPLFVPATW